MGLVPPDAHLAWSSFLTTALGLVQSSSLTAASVLEGAAVARNRSKERCSLKNWRKKFRSRRSQKKVFLKQTNKKGTPDVVVKCIAWAGCEIKLCLSPDQGTVILFSLVQGHFCVTAALGLLFVAAVKRTPLSVDKQTASVCFLQP